MSKDDLSGKRLDANNLNHTGLERAASLDEADLTGAKGVPAEVGEKQAKGGKALQNSRTDAGEPASERAQAEQDRQLETGEENPG